MRELHVETVDPSIKAMHVYNMVGYFIVSSGVSPFRVAGEREESVETSLKLFPII